METYKQENSWRNFQSDYIVKKKKKNLFVNTIKTAAGFSILLILSIAVLIVKPLLFEDNESAQKNVATAGIPVNELKKPNFLSKKELNTISTKQILLELIKISFLWTHLKKIIKLQQALTLIFKGFYCQKWQNLKPLQGESHKELPLW